MPGMRSESGHDPQAADPAAPGLSRAGQVAVVTGGSAGLGLAIATALAQAGSDVVLASRSAARCADAAARLSAQTGRTVTAMPATSLASAPSPASSRGSWPGPAGSTCW